MMERTLTDFQRRCEQDLVSEIEQRGRAIVGRMIEGQHETYITGMVAHTDLTFWIYEDGADFRTPQSHPRFEKPDYSSLDALANDFIRRVLQALEK